MKYAFDVVLVVLLLTLDMFHMFSNVYIVEFEQVNVDADVVNIVVVFLLLTLNMFHMFF